MVRTREREAAEEQPVAVINDPHLLPYWAGLSKSAKQIHLARYSRIGVMAAELRVPPAETIAARSPRSIVTAGVPANIRVNNPAEDTGAGNHTTQSETSIAAAPPNIVVTFNDSNPIAGFSGYANSRDSGLSFTDDVDVSTSTLDAGDGVCCVDRGGVFYTSMLQAADAGFMVLTIEVAKSTDGGATFGALVNPSAGIAAAGDSMDKQWLAVDATGGARDGRLYLAWTRFTASGDATLVASTSGDGGATWLVPQTLSTVNSGATPHQGASIAVAPDGAAYLAWLDRQASQILLRRSVDGGTTWTNPVTGGGSAATLTQVDLLNGGFEALSFPSIAVGPDGTVYITYHAAAAGDAANVMLSRSLDGGVTFSAPIKVSDDTGTTDQFQPSVAVTNNNVVGVMFYDRRNDPTNTNIDVYLAMSLDRGATFLANQRITETAFPPAVNFEPDRIRGDYMGDYNQMVAVGTRFYLAWGDNRDTVGTRNDPDVFFASIGTEDCYVRDNPADDGYAPSQPGQAWQSPDIQPAMNPSIFGTPNPVTVVVHNHGPKDATAVTTRLYWADPATYIPRAAWRPDRIQVETSPGVFSNTNEQLIGTVPAAGTASPAQPFSWNPPPPAWATDVGHFCLLTETESTGDPLRDAFAGGWDAIEKDNNLAVRNVHVQPLAGKGPHQIRFFVGADLEEELLTDLVIDARLMPPGWLGALRLDPKIAHDAKVAQGKIELTLDEEEAERDKERERTYRARAKREGHSYVPTPRARLVLRRGIVRVTGLRVSAGKNSLAALDLEAGRETIPKEGRIRLTQRIGGQTVGGLVYLLRPAEAANQSAERSSGKPQSNGGDAG